MANDLFGSLGNLGGLGDLLGGIAKNVVPKDTTEGKLLNAQSEVTDLKKQENELLLEIGRQAYEQNPSAWPQDAKLKLIRQNLSAAQATLDEANAAQKAADEAKKAAQEAQNAETRAYLCPSCDHQNPIGTKFCQECGHPLGASGSKHCTACGAELAPGTRFCGECGAPQQG